MKHNYSHSSHSEDNTLRVPPSQFDKLSQEFDILETWLGQENQKLDSVSSIEALKELIDNDDNNISIMCGTSHLINTHVKSLTKCAQ